MGRDLTEQVIDGMEYQGKGWLNRDSNESLARMPELRGEHPICPISLMGADSAISSSYKGKTYYFCSKDHKEMFQKHTDVFDRFLSDAVAKSKSTL